MPNPPVRQIITTRRALAEKFEVQIKTVDSWIYEWKKLKGCPCSTSNYDLLWIAEWLCQRKKTRPKIRKIAHEVLGREYSEYSVPSGNGSSSVDVLHKLNEAKLRKEEASALSIEMKNEAARADVIQREHVTQSFSLLFTQLRSMFMQLPAEMEASFPAKLRRGLSEELKQRVEHKLEGLHSYITEIKHDLSDPSRDQWSD